MSKHRMFKRLLLVSFLATASETRTEAASLPGNATTLREGHGNWVVSCAMPKGEVRCAMTQTQVQEKTRKRVFSIELHAADADSGLEGKLVLPFGLDLASGVRYQLDENGIGEAQPFRTCLPIGCIVDIDFGEKIAKSLVSGKTLNVKAVVDGGQEMVFSISLSGFSSAYDRLVALTQ